MDEWAVAYRKLLFREGDIIAPNPRFFSEPAALFIGDVKQARLDPILIQELVSLPALRDRWRRTNQISAAAEAEIDWKLLGRAMHSLQAGIQRWTTKHTVGMCGVGKFMELWGKEDTAACPICGEFEDHLHVPRCPSPLASNDNRSALLDGFPKSWLDNKLLDLWVLFSILVGSSVLVGGVF